MVTSDMYYILVQTGSFTFFSSLFPLTTTTRNGFWIQTSLIL